MSDEIIPKKVFATFKNGKYLFKIIELINNIVSNFFMDFSQNGLVLQGMDASNISLCKVTISSDAFEKLICNDNIRLTMKTEIIYTALKCCNENDSINIIYKFFFYFVCNFFKNFNLFYNLKTKLIFIKKMMTFCI